MKELIDFILKTGQPLMYPESNKEMRFKNIEHTPLETIYKYDNGKKEIAIRVPKNLDRKSKDIYDEIYVSETTRGDIYKWM